MHLADAAARGIKDGDTVRIFNDRGSFTARARVGDKARDGVVVALSVWWKKAHRRWTQRERGDLAGAHRYRPGRDVLRLPGASRACRRGREWLKTPS